MIEVVLADNGIKLPIAQLEQVFAYAGGFLTSITVEYVGTTYIQTLTNDGTNITVVSQWEAQ